MKNSFTILISLLFGMLPHAQNFTTGKLCFKKTTK